MYASPLNTRRRAPSFDTGWYRSQVDTFRVGTEHAWRASFDPSSGPRWTSAASMRPRARDSRARWRIESGDAAPGHNCTGGTRSRVMWSVRWRRRLERFARSRSARRKFRSQIIAPEGRGENAERWPEGAEAEGRGPSGGTRTGPLSHARPTGGPGGARARKDAGSTVGDTATFFCGGAGRRDGVWRLSPTWLLDCTATRSAGDLKRKRRICNWEPVWIELSEGAAYRVRRLTRSACSRAGC